MLGADWDTWQRTGWREVRDYTIKTGDATARVDFGFVEDVATIDVGFPELTIPTLICHGVDDDTVPIDHSRRFAAGRVKTLKVDLEEDTLEIN